MPLTEPACKAAHCPEGKPYKRHADAGGLYLEVTKTGAKLWRWKYRAGGKEKRLALGAYPKVSLKDARRARDEARALLDSGADPGEARQDAKRARLASSDLAFEKVARAWWEHWRATKAERHAGYVIARLEADAFPAFGEKPVNELTAPAFVRLAKSIEERGAADIARRVLQTCGQVMRYAVAHGLTDRNPVADVKPGDVLRARRQVNFARIELSELPELLRRIEGYTGSPFTRLGLKLMALTFVRTGELIGARWQEFDLTAAQWRIPAERTKSRREHLVPLAPQAIEVLRTLQAVHGNDPVRCTGAALLFPGERKRSTPMSNNTMLKALERMGYKGRMTGHGFRGVASTALNEMGYRPDVIEAQLAHVEENRVRAAYNHARYAAERVALMKDWANYCDAVRQGGAVIPLRAGAASFAA
ncbi:tyrosine-type recombinase/integrase [Thiomonas intermedia]|uniref:tyrosine-type recombinase/integrase n=1 Tax=Thiomonas intermedia TaxID=926 RepID=UPI0009A4F15A|nr:integrase arm-type DNA-binding domain-containing protein [Thiomonas intermedia]